ncbi:GNAT family N-acetyltransferase [Arthrobacter sp. H20]|uniref:GNAT family N-acetyltransferase n=1 Tax=Arthrobacter sp. H20 TaxID=1267981 RepID=UPI00047BA4FF|nr:GNAT family N-acetyltransferase [Arthrobacter sp. H20]
MSQQYTFSTSTHRIDRDRVHRWLSEQSYWALGRTRRAQDAAIDASRNYGVYDESGEQMAYGRVVTDGVTFAWLCDVFVATEMRGFGIGKMLAAGIVTDLESFELKRILLSTGDAHGLYSQYGFAQLSEPSTMMARVR